MKKLFFCVISLLLISLETQASSPLEKYSDPQNRFSFYYPKNFGKPSAGSNNGFGNIFSSTRFSEFSGGVINGKIVLGGEAVLRKEFAMFDMQALGGLYSEVALEVFPDKLRNNIIANLPKITATNFCQELTKSHHVDLTKPTFSFLTELEKDAILELDKVRNINPKIIRCELRGATVIFHKEAGFESGLAKARQNIYGAVRFLTPPFSSFQIIRVSIEEPSAKLLSDLADLVDSLK